MILAVTSLEITDTAIKIGLGALIAGIIGLIAAIQSQKHEHNKEFLRRKRDLLEKLTVDFEKINTNFISMYSSAVTLIQAVDREPLYFQMTQDSFLAAFKPIGSSLKSLH